MAKKGSSLEISAGSVDTKMINSTHKIIKGLAESYKDINQSVSDITAEVRENWVGKGENEFESQYNLLINKIKDFGDTLQDIYDALVDAEASFEDTDDSLRQEFVMTGKN